MFPVVAGLEFGSGKRKKGIKREDISSVGTSEFLRRKWSFGAIAENNVAGAGKGDIATTPQSPGPSRNSSAFSSGGPEFAGDGGAMKKKQNSMRNYMFLLALRLTTTGWESELQFPITRLSYILRIQERNRRKKKFPPATILRGNPPVF